MRSKGLPRGDRRCRGRASPSLRHVVMLGPGSWLKVDAALTTGIDHDPTRHAVRGRARGLRRAARGAGRSPRASAAREEVEALIAVGVTLGQSAHVGSKREPLDLDGCRPGRSIFERRRGRFIREARPHAPFGNPGRARDERSTTCRGARPRRDDARASRGVRDACRWPTSPVALLEPACVVDTVDEVVDDTTETVDEVTDGRRGRTVDERRHARVDDVVDDRSDDGDTDPGHGRERRRGRRSE